MKQEILLHVEHLRKTYGKHVVLDDINMTIRRGDIYGFVGKNGEGKTTLIRILSGLSFASGGEFSLFGVSSKTSGIVKARKKICAMVESPAVIPELTARQNMKVQCNILGKSYDCSDEYLAYVGLDHTGNKKVKNFSLGMRQRLAIAIALIGEPEVMLLDEPTNGLDPAGIRQIRELLLKLNREKKITMLVSSHILSELGMLASTFGFISRGVIVKEATAEEIQEATAEKCYLESDDVPKAKVLLERMDYQVSEEGEGLRVMSEIDMMEVCRVFAENGIRLTKHVPDRMDLEEYFMEQIGGNK